MITPKSIFDQLDSVTISKVSHLASNNMKLVGVVMMDDKGQRATVDMGKVTWKDSEEEIPKTSWGDQNLSKTGGSVAWHLIDRHAENWREAGDMMEAWARAWYPANAIDPLQSLVDQAQALDMGYEEPSVIYEHNRTTSGAIGQP